MIKAKIKREAIPNPFEQYRSLYISLGRCAANGTTLKPAKSQFAQKEPSFLGLTAYERIRPTQMPLDSILMFPYSSAKKTYKFHMHTINLE